MKANVLRLRAREATLVCALLFSGQSRLISSMANGETILLDDFSAATAAWPLDQNSIGNPELETGLGGVLGGVRRTFLSDFVAGNGISRVEVGVLPSPTPEFFEYVASVGTSANIALLYNADPTPGGATPNLNLNMLATPTIEVALSHFDYANSLPMNVTVTVSDGTNSAAETLILSQVVNGPPDFIMSFDFSAPRGLVDFGDIDSVEVEFDPGAAADFRVQEIRALPEPASLILMALCGLGLRRRR